MDFYRKFTATVVTLQFGVFGNFPTIVDAATAVRAGNQRLVPGIPVEIRNPFLDLLVPAGLAQLAVAPAVIARVLGRSAPVAALVIVATEEFRFYSTDFATHDDLPLSIRPHLAADAQHQKTNRDGGEQYGGHSGGSP